MDQIIGQPGGGRPNGGQGGGQGGPGGGSGGGARPAGGPLVSEGTTDTFMNDVVQASQQQPVIVDFWAPWCGPCRMIAPMVEELAAENRGSIKVTKINIDDNPDAAQNYGVSSIPTLIIFKKGEVVERMVGVQPKSRLQQALDEAKA